ncbi:hypothetical protein F383_07366 [Gossypium arboreum]|uniref:Uncharacterized protein n=1 Tax=Gossypium arboreum TaxID=29729 RepID=A0A0B0NJW4_GOSAR|nr:hypothetical protein F383_07366 [Gossypium arboreum]
MMKEKTFDVNDFPKVYLTAKVEEDENAVGLWNLWKISMQQFPYVSLSCCEQNAGHLNITVS